MRVSIARIAQLVKAQTPDLPILGLSYAKLNQLASTQERGWHGLCLAIADEISELQTHAVSRRAVSKTCELTNEGNQHATTNTAS